MADDEQEKPHLTAAQITAVVDAAKAQVQELLIKAKGSGKKPIIGKTSGPDDIAVIGRIIDYLATGFQAAVDGDADPFEVLAMSDREFPKFVRFQRDELLADIEDIEEKLPGERNKNDQIGVCYSAARGLLVFQLHEQLGIDPPATPLLGRG